MNLTLEISATLLEFDEAPYIRAAQHNAQINNNKDLYQDDFEQLTNKYSHYTDLQINVACGFRRNSPEYYYHIDTMKVYDSMGELFDLINDTQKAMSVMGGCSMTVTKLYKSNIWGGTFNGRGYCHHKVLNRVITECFLLYTDHLYDDWPNDAERLYL
ncbi:Uncharacterised protein [Providencia stuartii]|nr:Uncharacterised protein [Providencia stuartii]